MISVLYESQPSNPDTIVVKNEFYPKGLTEQQVYDYYIKNKENILQQVKNRELMFFIVTSPVSIIVKRKLNNSFIILNKENYETLITGRTISIHSTLNKKEKFGIIDIDYSDFEKNKEATYNVYNYLIKFNKDINIRFTGKTGFHIIYNLSDFSPVEQIKSKLKTLLSTNDFITTNYDLKFKRDINKPNLDLSPNKYKGGFITLNSLSIIGLKCTEVSINNLLSFNKESTII